MVDVRVGGRVGRGRVRQLEQLWVTSSLLYCRQTVLAVKALGQTGVSGLQRPVRPRDVVNHLYPGRRTAGRVVQVWLRDPSGDSAGCLICTCAWYCVQVVLRNCATL